MYRTSAPFEISSKDSDALALLVCSDDIAIQLPCRSLNLSELSGVGVDESSWADARWAAELQDVLAAVGVDASPEAAVEYFDLRNQYAQSAGVARRRYARGVE